ncbi:MAG: hypothetical protein FH753_02665 [Firmicutes bacterium]|nr:hypothetical protein [Bacillota bacterium]
MNVEEMLEEINNLKEKTDKKSYKRYKFELLKRLILRLESFSDCRECSELLEEFSFVIQDMKKDSLKTVPKSYRLILKKSKSHLQKKHKLVPKGYYTELGLTFGVSAGLIFGTVFSNVIEQTSLIGMGLPLGIGIGLSIGSYMDTKAKKDGLII